MSKPPATPIVDAANIAGMNGDVIAAYRVLLPREPTPEMLTAMTSMWYGEERQAMRDLMLQAYQQQPAWQELWVALAGG